MARRYREGLLLFKFERKVLFTITADQDKGVKESIKAIREQRLYQGDIATNRMEDAVVFFRIGVIVYNLKQIPVGYLVCVSRST